MGIRVVLTLMFALLMTGNSAAAELDVEIVRSSDGQIRSSREFYRDKTGKRVYHGVTRLYYDNGQKHWEGKFEDGLKTGLWVGWHGNGKKWQAGTYLDGKQHGKWTWFDINGDTRMEKTYENGKWVWFKTAKEAIAFVEDEKNILSYKGGFGGSSYLIVTLPSGKKVSNWRIDGIFGAAFRPLGKDAIPYLITALNHEKTYIRLGASNVLPQITGRKDRFYNYGLPEEERIKVLIRWQEWYAKNRNNARLDQPPKRIYEADEWDSGATAASSQKPNQEK